MSTPDGSPIYDWGSALFILAYKCKCLIHSIPKFVSRKADGHLASIVSQEVQDYFAEKNLRVWTGGSDQALEGTWIWSDCTRVTKCQFFINIKCAKPKFTPRKAPLIFQYFYLDIFAISVTFSNSDCTPWNWTNWDTAFHGGRQFWPNQPDNYQVADCAVMSLVCWKKHNTDTGKNTRLTNQFSSNQLARQLLSFLQTWEGVAWWAYKYKQKYKYEYKYKYKHKHRYKYKVKQSQLPGRALHVLQTW